MRRLAVLLLLLGLGCAPMLYGGSPGRLPPFVVAAHNDDVAFAETISLTWWSGTTIVGSASQLVPSGGVCTFALGPVPDGIEARATAWPSGQVWSGPEIQGCQEFHFYYPTGATAKQPP